jgi:Skp family chaperone for outer membrane proteins
MKTPLLLALTAAFPLATAGCASAPGSAAPHEVSVAALTRYYELATAPQRRAVRKPVQDQRQRALHALAEQSEALLARSAAWDSDTRLIALAEPQRSPARQSVAAFRTSLRDLQLAAAKSDVPAVRTHFARLMDSYTQMHQTIGPVD